MIEEISPEGDGLCEEQSTVTTPQPKTSHGEQRKLCKNTSSVTEYSFLLKQGVQLMDAAKELTDEKMDSLWEDIFKPLDFYSILHERKKQLFLQRSREMCRIYCKFTQCGVIDCKSIIFIWKHVL